MMNKPETVSFAVYEQVVWERDLAIHQLSEYGISLGEKKRPLVEIDEDFGTVLVCALRYCIGRQTYMPSFVIDFIRPLLPDLDNRTLKVMINDIKYAESYGDEHIDKPVWMRILDDIWGEICRRKEE